MTQYLEPYDPDDQQKKYELWRKKQAISHAMHALPKQVKDHIKATHSKHLSYSEIRDYLNELTRNHAIEL
jgi:hypothetical protein